MPVWTFRENHGFDKKDKDKKDKDKKEKDKKERA